MPVRLFRRSASLLLVLLAAVSMDASAQSRRDRAATEALEQRMQAAEGRYREAMVAIGNHDPEGPAHADAALEDMEDVVAACVAQRGCSVTTMLTTYERLLKLNADVEAGGGLENDDGPDTESHHAAAVARDVPEAARAAALLGGDEHDFDRMVQFNPAVQEGIRRWLTDMRDDFLTSHQNYQYLRRQMWPQYERAGLPEALLFGILAKESNGRVHSTSRAGASGPMQFMYATGRRFGLGEDSTGFDTRYDPYAASAASVAYLNERMGELNRNIELALAAYNGGEGRARRVHRANPGKSFWHADVYHEFPPETRDYVPMVIAAAWLFLHPREYGLTLPEFDVRPAKLQLQQPASIYQLTICLGNRGVRDGYMRALRNLNPRYRADDMLPAGAVLDATTEIASLYRRHCLNGSRAQLARELVASDPARAIVRGGPASAMPVSAVATVPTEPAAPATYRVQGGETLSSIARKFDCRPAELAHANGVRGPRYTIRPGQELVLQGCSGGN